MGNQHLLICQVEKIVVGRRVSFPLHILFPLFGIPHLIYSCNPFQVICEIISDPLWYSNPHYTVIIYILQLWLKSLGNDCKGVALFAKGSRAVISLKKNSSTGTLLNLFVTIVEQLLCRYAFFKKLTFLEHILVASSVIAQYVIIMWVRVS